MNYKYCPYCMTPVVSGQSCSRCGRSPEAYTSEPHHFPAGKLLAGRYYVGRSLGEGGFGITYLGWDTKLDRRVAIKEYFPRTLVRREASYTLNVTCYAGSAPNFAKGRDQFLQEARTLAKLDDVPEIVRVWDFFEENNSAYIVMEFLEGTTLKDLMAARGRMDPNELFNMLGPVLKSMHAMHKAELIHRDISPDNLMLLKKQDRVKLMDFGCAREIGASHTMTIMLKPGFAPREQYTGHEQGPWTDVYALCATMYYCLTGKVPPEVMRRMGGEQVIPPSNLGVNISRQQEWALMKGLEFYAENRWRSTEELYDALHGIIPMPALDEIPRTEPAPPIPWVQPPEKLGATTPVAPTDIPGKTEPAYSPTMPAYDPVTQPAPKTEAEPVTDAPPVFRLPADAVEGTTPAPAADVTLPAEAVNVTVPAPVADVTLPAEAVNVTVPAPAADVTLPAEAVNVTVPAPAADVTLPAEAVNVTVPADAVNVTVPAAVLDVTGPAPALEPTALQTPAQKDEETHPVVVVPPAVETVEGGSAQSQENAAAGVAVLTGEDAEAAPTKKKKGPLIAAACAAVLLIAAAGFWFLHPHTYKEWEVTKAPTCTESGLRERKCFCGKGEQEELAPQGHNVVKDAAVAATCTEAGFTEGSHCSVCGLVVQEPVQLKATGHDIQTLPAVQPTCTEEGMTEAVGCSICGYTESPREPIPALGHNPVPLLEVAATCSQNGLTKGSACGRCGQVLEPQKVLDKLPHTVVIDPAVQVTCTTDGKSEGSHCSVCGTVIQAQTVTEKSIGHTYSGNACTRCGALKWQVSASIVPDHYNMDDPGGTTLVVYVSYTLTGSEPGASTSVSYKATLPNGSVHSGMLSCTSSGQGGSLSFSLTQWKGGSMSIVFVDNASGSVIGGASYGF